MDFSTLCTFFAVMYISFSMVSATVTKNPLTESMEHKFSVLRTLSLTRTEFAPPAPLSTTLRQGGTCKVDKDCSSGQICLDGVLRFCTSESPLCSCFNPADISASCNAERACHKKFELCLNGLLLPCEEENGINCACFRPKDIAGTCNAQRPCLKDGDSCLNGVLKPCTASDGSNCVCLANADISSTCNADRACSEEGEMCLNSLLSACMPSDENICACFKPEEVSSTCTEDRPCIVKKQVCVTMPKEVNRSVYRVPEL